MGGGGSKKKNRSMRGEQAAPEDKGGATRDDSIVVRNLFTNSPFQYKLEDICSTDKFGLFCPSLPKPST